MLYDSLNKEREGCLFYLIYKFHCFPIFYVSIPRPLASFLSFCWLLRFFKGLSCKGPAPFSRRISSDLEEDEQNSNTGQTHSTGAASPSLRVPCFDTAGAVPPSPPAAARGAATCMLFMDPKGHESASVRCRHFYVHLHTGPSSASSVEGQCERTGLNPCLSRGLQLELPLICCPCGSKWPSYCRRISPFQALACVDRYGWPPDSCLLNIPGMS